MGKHENDYTRVERDGYPTPAWCARALAEHVHARRLQFSPIDDARPDFPWVAIEGYPRRGGRKLIDLTGMRFDCWTVLALRPERIRCGRSVQALWCCICNCGRERLVFGTNLRRGLSKSCGCLSREKTIERSTKHGHAKRGDHTSVYDRWVGMHQRCYNPNNRSHFDYGGRGTVVCERWHVFANFFADMGHPPRGKSLDRIDVNGNYEPGNCRWASIFEQSRNKRPFSFLKTWRASSDDDGENYAHDDDGGAP
jgi:hypothetical protein